MYTCFFFDVYFFLFFGFVFVIGPSDLLVYYWGGAISGLGRFNFPGRRNEICMIITTKPFGELRGFEDNLDYKLRILLLCYLLR